MQISIKPTNLNFTSNTQRQANQQPVLECRNFVAQQTEQIGNANNNAFAPSADCDTNDAKVKNLKIILVHFSFQEYLILIHRDQIIQLKWNSVTICKQYIIIIEITFLKNEIKFRNIFFFTFFF